MTSDLGRESASGRRQGRRTAGNLALAVATVVAALFVVAAINLVLSLGDSVPPRSALPDLPEGLRISDVQEGCGSGGCFLEFDVAGQGLDAEQVLALLPDDEECRASGLIDRRQRCTGYELDATGGVRGYVSIRGLFG